MKWSSLNATEKEIKVDSAFSGSALGQGGVIDVPLLLNVEMAGRREKYSQSLRGSKIAIAIVIGVLLGCVFAFLFPQGLFSSSDPPTRNRRLSKSSLQVRHHQKLICTFVLLVEALKLPGIFMGFGWGGGTSIVKIESLMELQSMILD